MAETKFVGRFQREKPDSPEWQRGKGFLCPECGQVAQCLDETVDLDAEPPCDSGRTLIIASFVCPERHWFIIEEWA